MLELAAVVARRGLETKGGDVMSASGPMVECVGVEVFIPEMVQRF